jgi:hypothetical protein
MPKGTKVHSCVQKCKAKKAKGSDGAPTNCYAMCQAATGQSYATGKKLKKKN